MLLILLISFVSSIFEGCLNPILVDESFRDSELRFNGLNCDKNLNIETGSWIRFQLNGLDSQIPINQPIMSDSCGTHSTGWIDHISGYPTNDIPIPMKICYSWFNEDCKWSSLTKVALCPNSGGHPFYIYEWNPPGFCYLGICLEVLPFLESSKEWCGNHLSYDPLVCYSHGVCGENSNLCECEIGYEGPTCIYYLNEKEDFLEKKNVESNRLYCVGENSNKLCKVDGLFVENEYQKTLGELSDETIVDICVNDYNGFVLNSKGELFLWGDEKENVYLSQFEEDPKRIILNGSINEEKIKKIGCTRSSLFVLTFDENLYTFGKNLDNELLSNSTEFQLSVGNCFDFVTGTDVVYVLLKDIVNGRRKILVKGNLVYGSNSPQIDTYSEVYLENFPQTIEYPKIKPMYRGVFIKFSQKRYYFAGQQHPTLYSDTNTPIRLNFDVMSHIQNYDPIDFFDRMVEGCIVIVSNNRFYSAGENCPNNFGFKAEGLHPVQISIEEYGTFKEDGYPDIIDFRCEYACYILTTHHTYVFGSGDGYVLLHGGFQNFKEIYNIGERIQFVIPVKGSKNVFTIHKHANTQIHEKLIVNKHLPEILEIPSILSTEYFSLVFRKPEVLDQLEPSIKIGLSGVKSCEFNGYKDFEEETIWDFWNENGFDYYRITSLWSDLNKDCGWQRIYEEEFLIFSNSIHFEQKYFIDYIKGNLFLGTEKFMFDIKITFPSAITIIIEIKMERSDFYSHIAVVKKEFSEADKSGYLKIALQHDSPILVRNPVITSLSNESSFSSYNISEDTSSRSCDNLFCFQMYEFPFSMKDGVCVVHSDITISGEIACEDNGDTNCPTELLGTSYIFVVSIESDEICGVIEEYIRLDGYIRTYCDVDHELFCENFEVGNYVYVEVDVFTNEGIDIVNSWIEDIKFNDVHALMFNQERTENGINSNLYISSDDVGVTTNSFSFQLIPEICDGLRYGDVETFKIEATIGVQYKRNNISRRVIQIRRDLGEATRSTTTIIGISYSESEKEKLSTNEVIIIVGCSVIFLSFIITCTTFTSICFYAQMQKKKRKVIKENLKDYEKERELGLKEGNNV